MDETVNNTAVDKIAKLARSAASVKSVDQKKRLIAVPDGVRIISEDSILKPGLDRTSFIDRKEYVSNSKSFVDFVESYGTEKTVVFVDKSKGIAQAILNYVPKSALTPEINPKDPKAVLEPEAYRCDWQVIYRQDLSENWINFQKLLNARAPFQEKIIRLTGMKDFFFEPYQDEGVEIRFQGTDSALLLAKVYQAQLANEGDMLNLILDRPLSSERIIAYFSFAVREGESPSQIPLLINVKSGKPVFSIIDAEGIAYRSMQMGMSKVRSKIKIGCNIFDADLSQLDI